MITFNGNRSVSLFLLQTLELLAEVAVLEEEVIRLEEQLVNFRQGLYQEAVYIASSKKSIENAIENDFYPNKSSKAELTNSLSQVEDFEAIMGKPLSPPSDDSTPMSLSSDLAVDQIQQCSNEPLIGMQPSKKVQSCSAFSEDGRGKENQSCTNSSKNKHLSQQKATMTKTYAKRRSAGSKSMEKLPGPLKLQVK